MRESALPGYAAFAFAALSRAKQLTKGELAYASEVAENSSRHFIAPDTGIAPGDQIAFNESFSRVLGFEIPELTAEQRLNLFSVAAAHPRWRIIVAPMLDTNGRRDLAERARRALPNEFNPGQPVIRPPDDGTVIRELTETGNLEGAVGRDGNRYVIRYRASTGELLPRSTYIDDLLARGEAIRGSDGTAWMFLVGDLRTYANDGFPVGLGKDEADKRVARQKTDPKFYAETYASELLESRLTASELYQEQWRDLPSTEALILTILMHNAAREPNRTYDINLANETVHEMTRNGCVAENPRYLTTVRFRTQDRTIGHYARDSQSKRDYFYVRPFVNAFDRTRRERGCSGCPPRGVQGASSAATGCN